jgi:hypothetical protein
MDADLQHDPEDIEKMLKYFPDYDMVVGARSKGGQTSLGRAFGNKIYNWLASYVSKFNIQDLTSGFRAVKADIAHQFLYLLPNTYSYPTTLTCFLLFLTGSTYYFYTFFTWGRFTNMSALLFTTSIIIFMIGLVSEQICQMRFDRSEGDRFI